MFMSCWIRLFSRVLFLILLVCKQPIGWAHFVLAVRIWLRILQQNLLIVYIASDLAENCPAKLINSIHCFGQFRSCVFSVRGAVARVRAVNRCAILHIGPVVAFLSH